MVSYADDVPSPTLRQQLKFSYLPFSVNLSQYFFFKRKKNYARNYLDCIIVTIDASSSIFRYSQHASYVYRQFLLGGMEGFVGPVT